MYDNVLLEVLIDGARELNDNCFDEAAKALSKIASAVIHNEADATKTTELRTLIETMLQAKTLMRAYAVQGLSVDRSTFDSYINALVEYLKALK